MQYVDFGRTGLRVSRLGFGGIPVQRIDEPGTRAMLKAAHEAGINYIDTARAYTVSEEWIGQALEELGSVLGLPQPPQYIEAYDISNLSSTSMVCGMIVFENGRPQKKAYKRFRMKEHTTQDDYACMKEALTRRLRHYAAQDDPGFSRLPDLILLDGGQGHVNTIAPVIQQFGLHIPLFWHGKKTRNTRTRAISTGGGEISLAANRSAFHLLTQIQDEVHRFSVAYMHSIHAKSSYQMELTKVRGIGEKKAQKLLLRFKTLANLKQATLEELESTAGISRPTAEALYAVIQEMAGGE